MSLLPGMIIDPLCSIKLTTSWASHMPLYIKGKEHGKLLVDSILNGPFQYGTMVEPGNETTPATIRAQTYTDLTDEEKSRESVDIKATNIDRVKLLIQGSELSLQEQESKLYDDFDTFTSMPKETIHLYYMRFAQLINDMHTIGMTMKPFQVNTKFVSHLQPEWSKFVTNVKLAKAMHTTNFDHLYGHLRQHETHANKVRLARQRQGVAVQLRAVKCYNCQEEGHFARQCTKPKRPKNSAWFKEKMLLTEALESRAYLDP
ncbi:retrovirus-related pol polyprotein from transposon TNT 1-94 [Tanacetum coccineum]|uniref:Retrovirus-related pol polyprotein from transposon TNT 1-94 n=1 Tax=Tanacetum coccineum TaxID=301880 RepID=A0ABQ4WZN0_9ASTR